MHSFKRVLWGGRKRKVVAVAVVALLIAAGSAFAAWLYFTGASGSGGAKVGSASQVQAITVMPQYNGDAVVPGTPGQVKAWLQNTDTTNAHAVTTLTAGAITSDNGACDTSGLHFASANLPSVMVPANQTVTDQVIGTLTADANLDVDCANSMISIALTGTTTP